MEKMLSWFHAYDRINYARHFTHTSFPKLNETHPSILDQFQRGNFAIKRTNGSFKKLPPDQVIEKTINKEQKGPGGITGMTTSVGCVQRWVFSSDVIAEWSHDFERSIGIDESESKPKDAGKKRMISGEKLVTSCYEVIDHWQNPFISQDKLIASSSGTVADDDTVDEITNAEAIGKTSLKKFIDDRIINGTTEFHEKIEKKQDRLTRCTRERIIFSTIVII